MSAYGWVLSHLRKSEEKSAENDINWLRTGRILFLIQFIVLTSFSYYQYHQGSNTRDFSIFAQAFSRIGSGVFDPYDTLQGIPYIANHFELMMWLIAPLYTLFRSTFVLLLLQDLFAVIAEYVGYRWIMKYTRDKSVPQEIRHAFYVVSLVLFIVNPWTYGAIAFDFHFETIAGAFALLTAYQLYAYKEGGGSKSLIFLYAILTMFCGDVETLYIVGVGLTSLLVKGDHRKVSLTITIFAMLYFLTIHINGLAQGSTLGNNYGYLVGGAEKEMTIAALAKGVLLHPGAVLSQAFGHRESIYANLSPAGIFGFLSPWAAGLMIMTLLPSLLVKGYMFTQPFQLVAMYPFLTVGTVQVLTNVLRRVTRLTRVKVVAWLVSLLLVVNTLGWGAIWLPRVPRDWVRVSPSAAKFLRKVKDEIPNDAEVIASQGFAGRFAARKSIYALQGQSNVRITSSKVFFLLSSYQGVETASVESALNWRAIRSPFSFSGGVVLPLQSLHWDEAKIRGYSGSSLEGRTLEPSSPELGYLMRREAVRKGPEAEEQTRFRIPKRWPVFD